MSQTGHGFIRLVRRIFSVFLLVEKIDALQKLLAESQVTIATLEGYRKQIELLKESHDATTRILTDERNRINGLLAEEQGAKIDISVKLEKRTKLLGQLVVILDQLAAKNHQLEEDLAIANRPLPFLLGQLADGGLLGSGPQLGALSAFVPPKASESP